MGRISLSFFAELKRRNVFRVGFAYVVGAWLVLQVTEVLVELLELPLAAGKFIVLLLAIGFVPVLVLSWIYELTADGLKRDSEVDRSQSNAGNTGRKLNAVTLVMLALTAGYFFWESRFKDSQPAGASTTITDAAVADGQEGAGEGAVPAQGVVATDKSIAVLPFVNMSSDVENEYFADGLSEEILNRLAQVPQLRVIGRTSSFAFKGDNRDLRDIGQLLDVANVLEGSVRRQGDSVRVTAQLIAASDGAHLWSQTYDREMEDVFQVQDDISQRVVDALDIVLDEEQRQRMLNAGVRNVEAFVAYQRGTVMIVEAHSLSGEAMYARLREANVLFARAAELAPPFAAALANMSDLYAHQLLDAGMSIESRMQGQQRAQALLDEAFEAARDPARKAMINLDRTFYRDDWSQMPARMNAALDSPGTASANWMELLMHFADVQTLTKHYERQLRFDPAFLLNHFSLVGLYHLQDQPEKAAEVLALAQTIDPDHRWVRLAELLDSMIRADFEGSWALLNVDANPVSRRAIMLLALEGRMDEARAMYEEWVANATRDARNQIAPLAWLGDQAGANEFAAQLDAIPGGSMSLIRVINDCSCGAPFDLSSTPNLAARLAEAKFPWPPAAELNFPAKDW